MIPDFALLLSEDGIVLLHRESRGNGWVRVDDISLDIPDLPTGMRQLCDTAHRLSNGTFSTKLLLPKSQLLYAEISVGDTPEADIRAALEDRTPYKAEQLVYDVSGSGTIRKVIAVARETLDEATAFVSQFGFNPTGFTTIPPEGAFIGEPNLGDFQGTSFVPDKEPVMIIDPTEDSTDEPAAAVDVAPVPETAPVPVTTTEPETAPEPEKNQPAVTEPAAFSSRRRGGEDQADRTGDKLTKRTPRIAIPDKNAKSAAPKVQIPLPEKGPAEPRIKAPSASRPVPPIIPAASPEVVAAKPSPMARFRRAKPEPTSQAPDPAPSDPLAAYAAKQQAGKPRFLGLILTGLLLLALGLFAALSSYLLPEDSFARWFGSTSEAPAEVVAVTDEPTVDQTGGFEDFDLASLPEDTNLPSTAPGFDDLPIDQELPELTQTQDPETPPTGPLDETDAQTAYVATGIWQRAPDFGSSARPDTLDALYLASFDPNPTFEDAPALPSLDPRPGDTRLAAPKAPPPPGVRFDLDTRGLVRPTPDGSLSPDGVIVFAGPPPIPPTRRDNTQVPTGLAPAIIDETEIEAPVETVALTPQTSEQTGSFADPALSGFKPRQRPEGLSEQVERARLGGKTLSELARLKPGQRPQIILDQAQAVAEARAAEAQAQAQAIQDALAEAETDSAEQERAASLIPLDEDTAPTALAVARSIKPGARPRGFENIVRAARRTPTTPPTEPDVQTASAARATGPAVARSSRGRASGPTANAVARAATDNNAIALGQVSLVGVFGTSASRRALVRLPSGRFKKVSVGDRVDGGRVAAIGASELKYQKSGRTLTLKMPKG